MAVTIRDIISLPEFNVLKLITNTSGLDNEVKGCGILDYEFDDKVLNRFKTLNFSPNTIIVTSFLYAKDNEHLIMDAIKNLVARNASCLVVKNIFKLNISSNVIKYADLYNFPIFIVKDQDIFFDEFIVSIAKIVENHNSDHFYRGKLIELMNCENNKDCINQKIIEINPLFESDVLVLYFKFKKGINNNVNFSNLREINEKLKIGISDRLIPYKNGFVLIYTRELFGNNKIDKILEPIYDSLVDLSKTYNISVSNVHHYLRELKEAISEALNTSILIDDNSKLVYHRYEDLGVYKVVLPYIDSPILKKYSDEYLDVILDFDVEFQGKFFETLVEYVLVNGEIDQCGKNLDVHKNTIRYRLEKINSLLNENILLKEGYEKVALAVRYHICRSKLEN